MFCNKHACRRIPFGLPVAERFNFKRNLRVSPLLRQVGPLEHNAGHIVTQGFVMAEELNMRLSSVFI